MLSYETEYAAKQGEATRGKQVMVSCEALEKQIARTADLAERLEQSLQGVLARAGAGGRGVGAASGASRCKSRSHLSSADTASVSGASTAN